MRAERAAALFDDDVLRRAVMAMGSAVDVSPAASLIAAVMAATLVAVLVMDFRRLTRCVALSEEPSVTECELVRAWACLETRPEGELIESEGRWSVNGREDACVS